MNELRHLIVTFLLILITKIVPRDKDGMILLTALLAYEKEAIKIYESTKKSN